MRKLSLLSALTLYVLLLLMANPAQAATFKFSSTPNIPIPDRQTVVDNIYVPTAVDLAEIRVGVYILHEYNLNIKITLRGPNGQSSILKNYNTGYLGPIGAEHSYALFKDGGASNINSSNSPTMGTFNPVTPLNIFAGIRSNGWWTLIVEDGGNVYAGQFVGWDIMFSGGTVVPPTTLFTQDGNTRGYYGGNTLVPPVGSGGALSWGNSADLYSNIITGSGITLGTLSGRLTMYLEVFHTWDADLQIYLNTCPTATPPNPPTFSQTLDVMTGDGGSNDDVIVTFDDMASQSITAFAGSYGAYSGRWRPENPFTNYTGSLDKNWFLEIWDNAGGDNGFINAWALNYEAAGYNILTPLHEEIATPLQGVELPSGIASAIIGYVPDVVSTIPPYSAISTAEQPTFALWVNNKQFTKPAVGFERIEAMNQSGGINYTGYWGPYAYSTDGATYVNADVVSLTQAKYKFRTTMNSRDDDDHGDDVAYSNAFDVTPATLSYAGARMQEFARWCYYGYSNTGLFTHTAGTQHGMPFTVFKSPTSRLTSVDIFMDSLGVATGPGGDTKIVVYACASGFIGAPTGSPIAESPILPGPNRIVENWYSYPIGPVGVGTGGVDLAPGTYVISLQTITGTNYYYRYYFPMSNIRENGYVFGNQFVVDQFGPLLPSATGITKLLAYSTSLASPPTTTTTMSAGNSVMSLRANFVTQNDFAIENINPRGTMNIAGAPFTPVAKFKSVSPQNGTPQSFNGVVKIFTSYGAKVYESEKTGTVIPYGTTDISYNPWTPATPGDYTIEVTLSRAPLDQNPTNNTLRAHLVIFQTGVAVMYDDNTSQDLLDATKTELANVGVTNAQFVNRSKNTINPGQYQTIFWIGRTTGEEQAQLRSAIESGSQVAYVYANKNELTGQRIVAENADKVFQIERAYAADYANLKFADSNDPSLAQNTPVEQPKVDLKITSKEDLLKYFMMSKRTLETPEQPNPKSVAEKQAYLASLQPKQLMAKDSREHFLGPVLASPYGEIHYVNHNGKDVQFIFAIPSSLTRRPGVTTTATAPTGFALEQNYPNPFNPTTTINYSLPEASHVDLRVFDVLGREVTRLVAFTQNAGRYSIQWKGIDNSGQSVASGIYFYRLEAAPVNGGSSFIDMKKMTFAK